MNHTAKNQEIPAELVSPEKTSVKNPIWFLSLLFISMILHALVAYANRPFQSSILLELMFGVVNFAMVLMMYYGISRTAFTGQFVQLGIFAAIAISISVLLNKQVPMTSLAAGWGTVLLSSVVCGTLAAKKYSLPKAFAAAIGVLTVFTSIQLYPLWSKLFQSASELAELMVADLTEKLLASGYNESIVQNYTEQFRVVYEAILRILPAMSLMAAMLQFAIAFWFFVRWLNNSRALSFNFPHYIMWKVPFGITPFLLAGVLMRLLGNDLITLVADNLIVILAVIYSIAGITLLEFFMKRFRFGGFSRFLIYLLLLLTHVIGFAFLALAGFVDSFYDWRRKYPLPLDIKTG